jgi:chromosome segregation ATPase
MVQNISEKIEQALAHAKKIRDVQVNEVEQAKSKASQAKISAEKAQKDLQSAQTGLIDQQVSSFDLRLSAQLSHFQDLIKESVHMGGEVDSLAKEHKSLYVDLTHVEKDMLSARRQHAIAAGKLQAIKHLSEQGNDLKPQEYGDITQGVATAHTRLDQQVKLLVQGQTDLETQQRELEDVYDKLEKEIQIHAAEVDDILHLSADLSKAHVALGTSLKEYEQNDANCEQIKLDQSESDRKVQTMHAAQEKLVKFQGGTEADLAQKPSLETLERDALDVEADCVDLDRRCSEEDETSCKLLKLNEQELELRLVAVQEKMIKMSDLNDDLALASTELSTLQPRLVAEQEQQERLKKRFSVCEGNVGATRQDLNAAKSTVGELEKKVSQRLKEAKQTGSQLATYGEQISKINHKIELLIAGALSPAEQGIISIEEHLAFLEMNAAIIGKSQDSVSAMLNAEQSNAQSSIQLQENAVEECQRQIQTKIDLMSSAEANMDLLVGKLESTSKVMLNVQETMQKLHLSVEPLQNRIANLAEPVSASQ